MKFLIILFISTSFLYGGIEWEKKLKHFECPSMPIENAINVAFDTAGEDPEKLHIRYDLPGLTIRHAHCVTELDEESLAIVEEYITKIYSDHLHFLGTKPEEKKE